jgi:hypothetical protein
MSQIWRISLSNLSRNLLEATELANVLQEVSSSIQVSGPASSADKAAVYVWQHASPVFISNPANRPLAAFICRSLA